MKEDNKIKEGRRDRWTNRRRVKDETLEEENMKGVEEKRREGRREGRFRTDRCARAGAESEEGSHEGS